MKNKFCREIISLTFMTLLFLHSPAQQKALKIGDTIPEEVWTTPLSILNSTQKTITLTKDRNKLILLDFWATWCSSCLKSFPKMEALEKQFGDQLKIVPVTKEDQPTLEKFFASKNGLRYKTMVPVTGDKTLHKLFPHTGVPFIVWMKDGKVLNTTDAEQVTEETIMQALENSQSSLQTVVQMDMHRPIMLSDNFDFEKSTKLLSYSFFSKGRIRGAGFGSFIHRSGNIIYGRQMTNFSLLKIYQAIAYELFNQNNDSFTSKRIINLVRDPTQITFTPNNRENDSKLYSYGYLVPHSKAATLYADMLDNLNQYSDYTGSIEKRLVKCLVLARTSKKDKISSKGAKMLSQSSDDQYRLQNVPLIYALNYFNENLKTDLPVIDETGYTAHIDLNFSNISDLKILQKELAAYDLALEEAERNILMLIIKDKNEPL
ncbi:TlpA family protein disulfide reductase [Kaistella flava (ex Peng et al. 2021)]|uniref:TlpA family protein disulfide reductase n=1 Tax=Kaistella flava (ex Peng et al. 2021) TaxID=2038776 RepID=A0A7M2Y8M0_9FLAO|nr:TlpA disulfide reductase family protein [Kaistella flava (ex Peng et al. 2021)]QOW10608.1 TlpA family protein disulfide reductase [Kaistella flava (ex Peng et al. 2021)]